MLRKFGRKQRERKYTGIYRGMGKELKETLN